jgi:hypothetical protein|tara:strand:+ start:1804 stop:2199 length:396 start_codon:yes stop_codon:yes gene_type:complete
MQNKLKSIAVIISTLIVGIVIGLLSARHLIHHRMDKLAQMRHSEGFITVIENIIEPTDIQTDKVKAVLQNIHLEISDLRQKRNEELKVIIYSMKSELGLILTNDQMELLNEMLNRRKWFHRNSHNHNKEAK